MATPTIDRKLNIVIPLERDSGSIHVYSTPISRAVFERYYLPISKAFARMHSEGLGALAGPRVALLLLKQAAMEVNQWDGPEGAQLGLVEEIRRLTNVVAPSGPNGQWALTPLVMAVSKGLITEDELIEVENALAFFTLVSTMLNRAHRLISLAGMSSLWGVQIDSLGPTDFCASLMTSTEAEPITPKTQADSLVAY